MHAERREPGSESTVWDGLGAEDLARLCEAPRLDLFDATDSTLDIAHALAEQGAPSGTVVLADAQRAGRGRMGRAWSSQPGHGVWVSVLSRPDANALDLLSLRCGLEIAERLDPVAKSTVVVKWPNDLVIDSSKLGGILIEARWNGTTLAWVGIGVGVNVKRPVDQPHAAGLPKGTARRAVLAAVVAGIRAAAGATGHLSEREMTRFRARDVLRGKRIVEPIVGTVSGIATNGALVVETRKGTERFRTGTIRMAEGT